MRVILVLFFILPLTIFSQEFRKCPEFDSSEKWNTPESFFDKKKQVVAVLDWLLSTPPSEQLVERSATGIFVMEWITKNPTVFVNVELGPYEDLFFSEDLMLSYLCGNVLYVLKHEGRIKPEMQRLYGLRAVLFVVEHSESYSKNKILKPLLRASRRDELDVFDKELWVNYKSQLLSEDK